jgi:ribosomal protein L33
MHYSATTVMSIFILFVCGVCVVLGFELRILYFTIFWYITGSNLREKEREIEIERYCKSLKQL